MKSSGITAIIPIKRLYFACSITVYHYALLPQVATIYRTYFYMLLLSTVVATGSVILQVLLVLVLVPYRVPGLVKTKFSIMLN